MSKAAMARARIDLLVTELEGIPAAVRAEFRQFEDTEAYEIIRRIQRRLDGIPTAAEAAE